MPESLPGFSRCISQAPNDAVKKMGQVLQALGANCLQEQSLPHLEFELGPWAKRDGLVMG